MENKLNFQLWHYSRWGLAEDHWYKNLEILRFPSFSVFHCHLHRNGYDAGKGFGFALFIKSPGTILEINVGLGQYSVCFDIGSEPLDVD